MTATPYHNTVLLPDHAPSDPLAALAALSQELVAAPDLEMAMSTALAEAVRTLDAVGAALFLAGDERQNLACRATSGTFDRLDPGSGAHDGLFTRCLQRNTVEFEHRDSRGDGYGLPHSLLCAPLALHERRLGVVVLRFQGRRTFVPRDLRFLQAASGWLALAVSNSQMTQALVRQEGVKRELELAAEIQRNLLPQVGAGESPVIGLNRPIRQVSGDFFDFFARDDGRIPFALGDVSGKGINAALLMAKTAGLFRCLAKSCEEPAALLAALNREVCETASRGMFVTMVAGTYDCRSGRVCFANAGHEPPLLRTLERNYHAYPAAAPPLGILPEITFEAHEIDLGGGEFYIFSDGLTEYRYGEREALGVDGLIQLLESRSEQPLDQRLSALLAELDQEGWEVRDDLTVLAIDDSWMGSHD